MSAYFSGSNGHLRGTGISSYPYGGPINQMHYSPSSPTSSREPNSRSHSTANKCNGCSTSKLYSTCTPPILQQNCTSPGGGRCPVCGYDHPSGNGGGGGGGDGSGDKPPSPGDDTAGKGGQGDGGGDGSNGKDKDECPDKDPDKSPGKGPDDTGPPYMNGDDPAICPDCCADFACYGVGVMIIISVLGVWLCAGHESFTGCLSSSYNRGCNLNKNLAGFFNKSDKNTGLMVRPGDGIPNHLRDQYNEFKKAIKNSECLHKYSEKCPGLVNYAGTLAGASIVSTRDTDNFPNPMLCRCHDPNKLGQVCDPSGEFGDCSSCHCDQIGAETIIKEDGKLIAGKCWAFHGVGKVLISLFYPITVTGVSIHHPSKGQLLPGFFSSAPKDFEIWGYNETDDLTPHFYGKFQYTGKNSPSEIFEVKNMTQVPYSQVQFNFLTNHGNMNYTAVYKVEVHGLLDRMGVLQ